MKRALLVHNDGAGDGKIDAKALSHVMDAAGITVCHCSPKDPKLDACLDEDADFVIVAGGDGTVARILARMPDHQDRQIAIVPLGTANNIAQTLGILSSFDPGAGEEILNGWQHADLHHLDIGIAQGPWGENRFVEAIGLGPLARTIIQFKTEGVDPVTSMRLGREALARAVKQCAPLKSRVTCDGETLAGEWLLIEAMNICHAGSRVHLAPDADPGDGRFDVVMLSPAEREDFVAWLEKGGKKDKPPVTVRRAAEIIIDWQGDPLRIDDYAPQGDTHQGKVHVAFVSQRLGILVPSVIDKIVKPEPVKAAS